MKLVKYFFRQMFFPLFYLLIMMMSSLAITVIDNNLLWLKYLLFALSFALYAVVIGAMSFKDGQEAVKTRHMNDLERLNIIRTGEDRPLDLLKEYKPWKGTISGLSACAPLIILMIIHTVCIIINPNIKWAGALAGFIYILVFGFFMPSLDMVVTAGYYYFSLISIPALMLTTGIPYYLGAQKQLRLYKKVEDKHREIYGEDA